MDSQLDTDNYTLFVGEGDFSFSANYILENVDSKEKVFASCLNSGSLTERQQNNIETIELKGGIVYTDVDATCLESHPEIKNLKFSKIIFNFPHIPGKMNIRNNRHLVESFFLSAEKILEDCGTIWVTLCQGQGGTEIENTKRKWCDTWQIVCLAASASLILYRVKLFDAQEYKMYRCTGFRGLQKPFNTAGALTHIFKRSKTVEINGGSTENILCHINKYLEDCETINRKIYRCVCLPSHKVLVILNVIATKVYQVYHHQYHHDLFICKKISSLNSDLFLSMDIDFCDECISEIFSLFSKKTSHYINSVNFRICCVKNISLNKLPFYHLFSCFSEDSVSLLVNLPKFLEQLKQINTFNRGNKKLFLPSKNYFHNKKICSEVMHNIQESVTRQSVRNVMNVYAKYSIYKGDELFFYSDVDFFLIADSYEMENSIKVGTVFQHNDDLKNYTSILLNLDTLACLKYHIMDYRILLSPVESFYSSHKILESVEEVYRSPSIFPPSYVHDTSFYINQDFCEKDLFIVIRNAVGCLVKSVTLIDSFYDKNKEKHSRCYRFVYQSCLEALSKKKANFIHTVIMQKALESSLNICLR